MRPRSKRYFSESEFVAIDWFVVHSATVVVAALLGVESEIEPDRIALDFVAVVDREFPLESDTVSIGARCEAFPFRIGPGCWSAILDFIEERPWKSVQRKATIHREKRERIAKRTLEQHRPVLFNFPHGRWSPRRIMTVFHQLDPYEGGFRIRNHWRDDPHEIHTPGAEIQGTEE
mgnify:CR=1 FL=1